MKLKTHQEVMLIRTHRGLKLIATLVLATYSGACGQTPIDAAELAAPQIRLAVADVEFTVASSVTGRRYQLQQSATLAPASWSDVGAERFGDGGPLFITIPRVPDVPNLFYRLALDPAGGFALIFRGQVLHRNIFGILLR